MLDKMLKYKIDELPIKPQTYGLHSICESS